jgi:NADH-quinone oxidoreductase subunit F
MRNHKKILTATLDDPNSHTLQSYETHGGYKSFKKALKEMKPDEIIEEVKKSGLRGRGGAGFPTGLKWGFMDKKSPNPKYLVNNSDESEPGTFKDRLIMERNPHQTLEGMMIASYALDVHLAFIYIRGEYTSCISSVEKAVHEAKERGYLGKNILGTGFDLEVVVYRGAGAYICGEETGLLSSIEGKRGYPKVKPPFPAVKGLFGCPTVVNNTETLANVPWIVEHGGDAYAGIGTEKSTGTHLFSVSGHVNRPGVYELEMGSPLMELIDDFCGDMQNGIRLKGIIPGGVSVPILTAEECKMAKLDFESMQEMGSYLGSGGVIVFGEEACMVRSLLVMTEFFADESCGQCTPCREGTGWALKLLHPFIEGKGKLSDLDLLVDIAKRMEFRTICALADAAVAPIESIIKKYRKEFEDHIANGGCESHRN